MSASVGGRPLAQLSTQLPAADRDVGMGPAAAPVADLLHCLGFSYLRHGQARRAAVLLMTAGRAAPGRPDILRTLAAALVEAGLGERAEEVLDQLVALDPAAAAHPMMRLLRARALLLQGRADQARTVFGTGVGPGPGVRTGEQGGNAR